MAGYGPLYPVDGPRPSAPRFGLLAAAGIINEDDEHWMNGLSVWPYPGDLPTGYDPCSDTSPHTKPAGTGTSKSDFGTLTIVEPMTCTARSIHDQATYVERASVALAAREGYAVEHEFWTGLYLPGTPHLSDASATLVQPANGAAVSVTEALAELEDAVAATGIQGVIHATAGTVSRWSANQQVFMDGAILRTVLGTIVVRGVGYPGTAPVGHTAVGAKQAYAFATGPVEIRRSEITIIPGSIAQATDKALNMITYRAERYYATTWDRALQAAILIDRTL